MTSLRDQNTVLERLCEELRRIYGTRIERIVLFGSHARGEARTDSDYDVAVFLNQMDSLWNETAKLARIGETILDKTGAIVNALPLHAREYEKKNMFMNELRKDGREL